ncbi:MAG: putative rane protein [Herbinix sp.]|jgi:ABC-2 type transport system permease protein|nr:putative rane protein [Herbinix sp.]
MLAIYKKELRSYFTSMIGYVFIAFFLVIIGLYFVINNFIMGYANFEYVLSGVSFIFILLVPLLTMRLIAEENKQKTDQLLLTSPLSANSIILGKFLAVLTIFMIVIAVTCTFPLIIKQYGVVPMASAYSALVGFTLLGAAYLALGLFISSLTESQVVAAVITFITFLLTFLMDSIASVLPTDNKSAWVIFSVLLLVICVIVHQMMHNLTVTVGIAFVGEVALTAIYLVKPTLFDGLVVYVFNWFSVLTRFDSFTMGIFDLTNVVYYLSIIFIFLFLSVQSLKKKRWS